MSLDLGALVARIVVDPLPGQRGIAVFLRSLSTLDARAVETATSQERLGGSIVGVGDASARAAAKIAAGIGATTEADIAESKLTQAKLRNVVATERLSMLQEKESATTAQMAAAQASLIASNDKVAASQERVNDSQKLSARYSQFIKDIPAWAKFGAAGVALLGAESIKSAVDYQKLIVNLQTGAGESQRNLGMVGSGILHMAGQVGDSAQDLAKAAFTVESAGYHGAAGLTLLRVAAEGAKVDNADLTTVVDATTSAMNAYHEPAARAAAVTNTLIASAAVGKMHLQDLSGALGTVLPIAAELHVPLAQVGAAIATMTMQGTNAAKATTSLRYLLASFAGPSSIAAGAMQTVGLSSKRVADSLEHDGLIATLHMVTEAIGKKFPAGSAQYVSTLKEIVGGTRGWTAALELSGKNMATLERNVTSINDRVQKAGSSVSDWTDVQKTFNVQLSQFVDGLEAAAIHVGEDLLPAVTLLLRALNATAHAVGDVTHFLDENRTVAEALAAVLIGRLGVAMAATITQFIKLSVSRAGMAIMSVANAAQESVVPFGEAEAAATGLESAMGALSSAGAVVLGLGLITSGVNHLEDKLFTTTPAVNALTDAMVTFAATGKASGTLADTFGSNLDKIGQSAKNAHEGFLDHADSFFGHLDPWSHEATLSTEQAQKNMAALDSSLAGLVQSGHGDIAGKLFSQFESRANAAGVSTQQFTSELPKYGQALDDAGTQAKLSGQKVDQYGQATQRAAQSTTAAIKAATNYADALHALTDPLFAENEALQDLAEKQEAARKAVAKYGADSHQAHQANLDLASSALTAAADSKALAAAVKDGTVNLGQARATLRSWVAAGILTSKQAQAIGVSFGGLVTKAQDLTHGINKASRSLTFREGKSVAADWVAGIVAELENGKHETAAASAQIVQSIIKAHQNEQQSHSPSKVARGLADDWVDGIVMEMNARTGDVESASAGLARAAAKGVAKVFKEISGSTAPVSTDPSTLAAAFAVAQARAESRASTLPIYRARMDEANELSREAARNLKQIQDAAKSNATSMEDAASKAHDYADNLDTGSKAADRAKDAAEKHARALSAEAHSAEEAASSSNHATKAAQRLANEAAHAATVAKAAYDKAVSAASNAAQEAETAAASLVSSLQSTADSMQSAVQSFESTASTGLTGDDSLSTLWGNLSSNGDATVTGLQSNVDSILASAVKFDNDLKTLKREGAGESLISQIFSLGPTEGDDLAEQLIAAGKGSVGQLSASLGTISSFSNTAADQMAQGFYGSGERAMDRFIKGLEKRFPDLRKALRPIDQELAGLFTVTGTGLVPAHLTIPSNEHLKVTASDPKLVSLLTTIADELKVAPDKTGKHFERAAEKHARTVKSRRRRPK